jgi:cell division transport system permease protein
MSEVFSSIRRTPYQSLAAFLILFFTLFLATLIFVTINFLSGLLAYVETRPQVIVYFQTDIEEKDIFKIRDELTNSGKIKEINYVSQEDAYKIFQDLNKDNPLLVEMTSSDILPASIEIFATKPDYLKEIAKYLETKKGVNEVIFQEIIVDKLLNLTNSVRVISLALFTFLIVMSIIVIVTTISFKIAMKKNEIEILKLLGADNFYIKRPFLIEAMVIGFISGVMACSAIFMIIFSFYGAISNYLQGINILTANLTPALNYQIWPLNPLFLSLTYTVITFFGILISLVGSYLATKKYL